MRTGMVAAVAAACVLAGSASAQSSMTLESFVTRANRIPLNATAMLRPDAHRGEGVLGRVRSGRDHAVELPRSATRSTSLGRSRLPPARRR